jgi:ABC-type sugar transport system substrate-binding protein
VTYGGSDEALQAVRRGDFAALAYQYTVVAGRASAWVADRLNHGNKLPANIYVPQPLVSKSNVGQFQPSAVQIRSKIRFGLSRARGRTTLVVNR